MTGFSRSALGRRLALYAAPLLATLALPLIACDPASLVVGTAATAGVAASSERGLAESSNDFQLEARIAESWLRHDHTLQLKLSITVHRARVMLTGVVDDPEKRDLAVRLTWQVLGVDQVYDEIQVRSDYGPQQIARDSWISAQLVTALALDKDIYNINYQTETSGGVIHLMGDARSQEELDRVIAHARNIPGVSRVVSHVIIYTPPVADPASASQQQGFLDSLPLHAPPIPGTLREETT